MQSNPLNVDPQVSLLIPSRLVSLVRRRKIFTRTSPSPHLRCAGLGMRRREQSVLAPSSASLISKESLATFGYHHSSSSYTITSLLLTSHHFTRQPPLLQHLSQPTCSLCQPAPLSKTSSPPTPHSFSLPSSDYSPSPGAKRACSSAWS